MSEESSTSFVVKKKRHASLKKVGPEISENENNAKPHCSKKIVEKKVKEKKSLTKFGANGKNQQKDKNNLIKLEAAVEKLSIKQLSAEHKPSKQSQKNGIDLDSICQNVSVQFSKERKQKYFKIKKKVNKSQENEIIEVIEENSTTYTNTKYKNTKQEDVVNAKKTKKPLKEIARFPEQISVKQLEKLLQDKNSTNTEYVEGHLRINPMYIKHAYLSLSDDQRDLLIIGMRDRNRALEGDLVVARINPPKLWQTLPGGQKQKTGVIVCIREKIHPRTMIGHIKQQGASTVFYPRNKREPLLRILTKSLKSQFTTQPEDKLFLAAITNWVQPEFAVGVIKKMVGTRGDISTESQAILLEHDLDVTPYKQEAIKDLPNSDYVLTENDLKDREDWRDECVFTIDPDTAVDLDDAVSCKLLENGNYEIGVHISDVTYYLEFLSLLDVQVAKRATTVYMTDKVYHMLPKQLCQICSLLPGQDKLTFSVICEMTPDAKVVKHRFAKTVIKSCCQMAYQHAQQFIENPGNNWPDDFLNITGNFSPNDLSATVNILHGLATQMRNERFANGALRMDQPKLHVIIDRSTGLPTSYFIEEQKDSNRLIEEFMLLANMTVATHLYDTIPETALLRNHREPLKYVLNVTKDILQKFGILLDIESSGSLHASIKRYEQELESESSETKATIKYRMMVINNLCAKAMTRATYKCSSTVTTEEELKHYALNVPFYTHFTSPIRRYSDCVVHRLLYSTISNEILPEQWSEKMCMKIAANCNRKKYSAKMAQERSSELYFTYLIDLHGPRVVLGIVLDVKEQSIDVILCQIGIKLRVYLNKLEYLETVEYSAECSVPTISITWKQPAVTQVINVFTLLYLRIEKHPESFKLTGILLPPTQKIEL